ncbi:MAG: zeta toxin family protein [Patescibacteria group bacterium]
MDSDSIQSNALAFARKNRKKIAKELTDSNKYHPDILPVSVFMAGSPGAGKTEFSKNIISILEKNNDHQVIRIDGDDIRQILPGYTGDNSYLFQGAVSLIVEKIHDCALAQKQSFVFDGTFAKYDKAADNVRRSLGKGRRVFVFYLYQNPQTAWRFTEKREKAEGRNIPKASFIEQFFGSKETVTRLRREFGSEVKIFLIIKNYETNSVESQVEIKLGDSAIDGYIKERYNANDLMGLL